MCGMFAGLMVEKRMIRFRDGVALGQRVIRMAGAPAICLLVNALLKLPFSAVFLENGSLTAGFARAGRYFCIGVCVFALRPMVFVKREIKH